MKSLTESLNDSFITESADKYELVYLTFDQDQYIDDPDEGLSGYLYENDGIKHDTFTASNDRQAVKKAQQLLDKQNLEKDEVYAATLYIVGDNGRMGTEDNADVVETLFHKEFDKWFKSFCEDNGVDCNY